MTVETRHLFGEEILAYEVSCPADDPDVFRKLFKAAARLIKDEDPIDVNASGPRLQTGSDRFVLTLFFSVE